jgi:hypothetical protein
MSRAWRHAAVERQTLKPLTRMSGTSVITAAVLAAASWTNGQLFPSCSAICAARHVNVSHNIPHFAGYGVNATLQCIFCDIL